MMWHVIILGALAAMTVVALIFRNRMLRFATAVVLILTLAIREVTITFYTHDLIASTKLVDGDHLDAFRMGAMDVLDWTYLTALPAIILWVAMLALVVRTLPKPKKKGLL